PLLDPARDLLRSRHYSLRTEECYLDWIRRVILFAEKRHPLEMNVAAIEEVLTHLAVDGHVSASTQPQALNALVVLYQQVLETELAGRVKAVPARKSRRIPVVLSPSEARAVLEALRGADGLSNLMGRLQYGAGLRLLESCRLRVQDVDLARGQLVVREGQGHADRVVLLPRALRPALEQQLLRRKEVHTRDLERGLGWVITPDALARKYPRAPSELGWQFVFGSRQVSQDPRSGRTGR